MGVPLPFQVARETSNTFNNSYKNVRDTNAIENILAESMQSGDPAQLQQSIGKILSQVSPERQQSAIQYLEGAYKNVQARQQQELQQKSAKQAGYTYGAPPQVQAQQVKDANKGKRLEQYGLGGNVSSNGQSDPSQPPSNVPNQLPNGQDTQPTKPGQNFLKKLDKDQLKLLTGHPDKEVSEPAKAELKSIDEEENRLHKQKDIVFKSDLGRAEKVLERADAIAEQIPQKRTSVNLMKDAVANRNLGFFSPDNLAEITGIEGFRSQEGSIFKTAGKEYFLGNIARAGARPNQWIEQQISDMMAKVGRSPEANFSVLRALENELDLDEARVKITNDISDRLKKEGDLSQGKLGKLVNEELSQYADKKQDILFNDLRAIKAIAEKAPQKFRKVEKGTKVSDFMAQALLQMFNNDPDKAANEAKKLGYDFE